MRTTTCANKRLQGLQGGEDATLHVSFRNALPFLKERRLNMSSKIALALSKKVTVYEGIDPISQLWCTQSRAGFTG